MSVRSPTRTSVLEPVKRLVYNQILYSYDLTQWTPTAGTSSATLDAVGIGGVANTATTLTDNDTTKSCGFFSNTVTIKDDLSTHLVCFIIKKDSDTSRYPTLIQSLGGGTSIYTQIGFDTQNGTGVHFPGSVGTYFVTSYNDWWLVGLTITNNNTGNNQIISQVKPAGGVIQGTNDVTATGSCIVGHAAIILETTTPFSPIITNGAIAGRYYNEVSPLLSHYYY